MLAKQTVIYLFLHVYLLDGIAGQLHVTLAVFSGRPDPQWEVDLNEPRSGEIQRLWQVAKQNQNFRNPDGMPSILGYKGFLIQDATEKHPVWIVGSETKELQKALLQTLPEFDSEEFKKFEQFKKQVLKEISQSDKLKISSTMGKRYAYPYDPNPWNVPPTRLNNNCYNYANNKATNTFAQPGRGSGHGMLPVVTDSYVRNAAINDGLENLETDPQPNQPMPRTPNGKQHLVALVVDMFGLDFHWYRLDMEGIWSHKPGTTAATHFDNNGNIIQDPRQAAMGLYQFVCFLYSNKDKVTIA